MDILHITIITEIQGRPPVVPDTSKTPSTNAKNATGTSPEPTVPDVHPMPLPQTVNNVISIPIWMLPISVNHALQIAMLVVVQLHVQPVLEDIHLFQGHVL